MKKLPQLGINEPIVNEYKMNVMNDIKNCNRCVEKLRLNLKSEEKTFSDILLVYFSPLLLIIGMAIRITKVTGGINV